MQWVEELLGGNKKRPKCKILFQSWVGEKMRENSNLRERKGQEDIELGGIKSDKREKKEWGRSSV